MFQNVGFNNLLWGLYRNVPSAATHVSGPAIMAYGSTPYVGIMAYGSTPYVGMTPKKNGGHIQSAQMTRSKCPR